jgi:hypothetical protein
MFFFFGNIFRYYTGSILAYQEFTKIALINYSRNRALWQENTEFTARRPIPRARERNLAQ